MSGFPTSRDHVKQYRIRYAAAVVRELRKMSPDVRRRIHAKIERLSDGLVGDVKRLTNFSPEYRLRVGDWRVLSMSTGIRSPSNM